MLLGRVAVASERESFCCLTKGGSSYGSQRARRKGRIAMPVGTGRRCRSRDVLTLPKSVALAAADGHEIKLAGETGEACGRVALPIGARHGSRDGQTVIVESEILSIKHTYGN
jgi:hypothetical protein